MSGGSRTREGKGARILVVEDNAFLAFGMAKGLREAGFEVVGPVATVAAAMRLLGQSECNAAVLDVRLGRRENFRAAGTRSQGAQHSVRYGNGFRR